jgi:hypothetical protein
MTGGGAQVRATPADDTAGFAPQSGPAG